MMDFATKRVEVKGFEWNGENFHEIVKNLAGSKRICLDEVHMRHEALAIITSNGLSYPMVGSWFSWRKETDDLRVYSKEEFYSLYEPVATP